MLPVIALVGRPNVGKSTLFNRLTRTRDALVADFPGLTRDRKYGQADYEGYEFIVVDTGGIDGSEQGIETEMAEQSLLAIEEADIVLFLVDARAGMTAADQAIANHLRKQQKKCFVVANKVDGIDADSYCAEFFQLSLGDVHHIAAAHGRGITQLLETTLQPVIAELAGEAEELEEKTMEIALRLANGPSVAYRYMKENLNRAMSGEVDDCLDLEATHHIHCGQTEDHRNAVKAFVEKTEPVFKGK